jgi:C4-type Zn-finger protein
VSDSCENCKEIEIKTNPCPNCKTDEHFEFQPLNNIFSFGEIAGMAIKCKNCAYVSNPATFEYLLKKAAIEIHNQLTGHDHDQRA